MSRTAIKYSKWKIFFDGVEMPWMAFSVNVGVDSPGQATIHLVPDAVLLGLRPRTMVHIFMYDEFEEGAGAIGSAAADKKVYKLYWEGEVDGISDTRSPQARAFTVTATGLFAILARHSAFMGGAGGLITYPTINGSALVAEDPAFTGSQLMTLGVLGDAFDPEKVDPPPVLNVSSSQTTYADRVLRLAAYLSSYNVSLRMQVARVNLFGKITAIWDRLFGGMLPYALASDYFKQISSNISPEGSVLDILSACNQGVFYHYVSVLGPKIPPQSEQPQSVVSGLILPIGGGAKDPFAIARPFLRNDYIFLPETYYAIPPSCNVIFPEFIESFSTGRSFSAEPTRVATVESQLGTNMVIMSPPEIFRYEAVKQKALGGKVKPEEMWGMNQAGLDPAGRANPLTSPSGINLFAAITDSELEKGIIPTVSYPSFQLFSSLSNVLNPITKEGKEGLDQIRHYLESMGLKPDLDISGAAGKDFLYLMKNLADYNYTLLRFTRQASLTMLGHRWMVPGLPAVVLMTGGSYIGWVRATSFSVDQDGQESSSVALDYIRPIAPVDYDMVRAAEELNKDEADVKFGVEKVNRAYDDYADRVKQAYNKVNTALQLRIVLGNTKSPEVEGVKEALSQLTREFLALLPAELSESEDELQALLESWNEISGITSEGRSVVVLRWYDEADVQRGVISTMGKLVGQVRDLVATNKEVVRQAGRNGEIPICSDLGQTTIRAELNLLREMIRRITTTISKYGFTSPAKAAAAVDKLTSEYPFPPLFANDDLIDTEKAEILYDKLLGARKYFTDKLSGSNTGVVPLAGGTKPQEEGSLAIAVKQRMAYTKFAKFLFALRKVFPIGIGSGPSEWEEKATKSDASESVQTWEEREILRRTSLQDLASFLEKNKLTLGSSSSDWPTQVPFYVMKPVSPNPPTKNADGVDLVWDDTLFSKVVDEFAISPRDVDITKKDIDGKETTVTNMNTGSNPEIVELRKSVRDPLLTTKTRQEFLIAYARRHFGARAHDGT